MSNGRFRACGAWHPGTRVTAGGRARRPRARGKKTRGKKTRGKESGAGATVHRPDDGDRPQAALRPGRDRPAEHGAVGRQVPVYVAVVTVNYLAWILGVGAGLAALGLSYQLARGIAAVCEAVYMYAAMRWVIFRDVTPEPQQPESRQPEPQQPEPCQAEPRPPEPQSGAGPGQDGAVPGHDGDARSATPGPR